MTLAARGAGGDRPAPEAPRPRGPRRALLPIGIGLAALALALLAQQVFDPFRTDVPLCLVHRLTGLDCPGCGATRAVHALLDGDLPLALRNNVLIVVALPIAGAGLVLWAVRRVQGRVLGPPPPAVLVTLAVLALVFAVLRNLQAFWFIAPTTLVGA